MRSSGARNKLPEGMFVAICDPRDGSPSKTAKIVTSSPSGSVAVPEIVRKANQLIEDGMFVELRSRIGVEDPVPPVTTVVRTIRPLPGTARFCQLRDIAESPVV
jgi:hypothetical protein